MPGVDERAWRQVSVTARECIGRPALPVRRAVFRRAGPGGRRPGRHRGHQPRPARDRRAGGRSVLPEHDVVIIDEAHDLVDRVTSVATAELSAPAVETAARRAGRLVEEGAADRLKDAGHGLEQVLAEGYGGADRRADRAPGHVAGRGARRRGRCAADIRTSAKKTEDEPEQLAARRAALASLDEVARRGRADPRRVRRGGRGPARRGVAGPARRPRLAPPAHAAGGAAAGERAAARSGVRPQDGGADLGHAVGRRLVRAAGAPVGPAARLGAAGQRRSRARGRAHGRRRKRPDRDGQRTSARPDGLVRARRRLAVRPPAQRDPVRGPAPAAAGPRRAAPRPT